MLSHSYAMDVIPALLSDEEERKNIERCTQLLERAAGQEIRGWLSPRGTSKTTTPKLLAKAGYRWYGDVFDSGSALCAKLRWKADRRYPAFL